MIVETVETTPTNEAMMIAQVEVPKEILEKKMKRARTYREIWKGKLKYQAAMR